MDITFFSVNRGFITGLVVMLVLALYFWLVRPRIKDTPEFIRARGSILTWLKARWDVTAAAAVALTPIVWNGALDLIIAVSLALPDVLPALAGLDLSVLVLPPWVKNWIQFGATALPVLRAAILKSKSGGG